ncbi:MAG: hypothetical protein R2825_15510 [Saprospiraceae bacterium]
MNLIYTFFLTCILFLNTNANPAQSDAYQYSLDLINVENDQVQVELITPKINKKVAVFYMPKIIPGTYTVYDFGRFISDFKAFDKNGKTLAVTHPETNTWKIKNADQLYRVTYKVDDSFDSTSGKPVSGMSGTNIEANKNFLLNGHGFYGYFKGMKFQPYQVSVKKPEGFAHQSAYEKVTVKSGADYFEANNYQHIVDMPVMYCRPDTAIVKLGDTEVLIAVYSPNKIITAEFLRERYTKLLHSQSDYLGGKLPVKKYAFLMYFMGEQLPIGTGALEHNTSSVYCLPEMDRERIAPFLVDIASHEFFHIITPLTVHAKEIHYFDFNDPDMSRHLWMYEGITEYFSHHNQVRSGMISQEQFLQRMGQKIQNSKSTYIDDLSFTKLSRGCLEKHEHQYGNVYEKGALIGMCLDIELLNQSEGKYGVVDMMQELSNKYGSEKPFKDRQLIREIKKMTYPEIGDFLNKYVKGKTPIPYQKYFDKTGVAYLSPKDTMVYSLGDVQLGYNDETQRLVVTNNYSMSEMGRELNYRVGDELVSIGGQSLPPTGLREFMEKIRANMQEGKIFEVVVARKNADGKEENVNLYAITKKVKRVMPPGIEIMDNPSPQQLALRNAWIGKR